MSLQRWRAVLLAMAAITFAGSTALALAGRQPFHAWYYHFAWYSILLAADSLLAVRKGGSPWLGNPRFSISLLAWSVPVWLLFEFLNLRVANWYYVLASPDWVLRRLGTVLAFATVLPAIFLAYLGLDRYGLASGWRISRIGWLPAHPGTLRGMGVCFAVLAIWQPGIFFPLIWGAVTLLLEPFNLRRDPSTSLIADLAAGRPGRVARLLVAGAGVGLVWELLNSIAQTRWIYTVPGLENLKLFEMPLLGYLGFPVFALDCFVVYHALVNVHLAIPGWESRGSADAREWPPATSAGDAEASAGPSTMESARVSKRRLVLAGSLAALFSAGVMWGMDRWTVDSYHARLADLAGPGVEAREQLSAAGLRSVGALSRADPGELTRMGFAPRVAEGWIERARLAVLRGMGVENAAALEAAGIGSVCLLARADAPRVREAIRSRRDDPRAGSPARIRVWQAAARRACRDGGPDESATPR